MAALVSIIKNSSDIRILLDSYYIRNRFVSRDVCFITMDKRDILDHKPDIERIINGIKIGRLK